MQAQTVEDWELIVVDDGSTDDTAKAVAQFQDDPRVRYHHQSNTGVGAARNAGLRLAQGTVVGYLDSDDTLYFNCLEVVNRAFDDPAVKFVATNYDFAIQLCDSVGRVIATTTDDRIDQGPVSLQQIAHWEKPTAYGSGFFHRRSEVLASQVRWDEKLARFDDWDFVLQLAQQFPNGFRHIPERLYRYTQRYGTDGACSSVTEYTQWADSFEAIWRKHHDHPLMQDQPWYPSKVEKYQKLQADFDAGRIPLPQYKYFPEYAPKV